MPIKDQYLPELLAPAGDFEKLQMALRYGADAVYLGGDSFTMRASAGNFEGEALERAVCACHAQGVRAYLTCNTLPRNDELDGLAAFLEAAARAQVDALIVADLGVMAQARRLAPQIEVHASTQAGVVNYRTACALYELGARRVVLARELTLEEIRVIRERTPPELELEAFVHGAMCMSVSGRCLLSDYFTGRDANRGACAQPCRWKYHLVEEKRPGQYFPIGEEEGGSYILNAKDMCLIGHLDQLAQAGISSFKIEGRAKSAYYTGVITNAYRAALDAYARDPAHYRPPAWAVEETLRVSHRQYCTGFYFGRPEQAQYCESGGYVRDWDVCAVAEGMRGDRLLLSQRNKFRVGDTLEVLEPGTPPAVLPVTGMYDDTGAPIEAASHPVMRLSVPCPFPVRAGSILRRRRA